MSDFGISDQGFKRKRLDQLLTELQDEMKSVFGDNFNTASQTPDGQVLGTISESNANLWEIAEEAYNAYNPSASTGNSLSNLVQLNGITRLPASASTVVLTITGINNTIIPIGSLVSDGEGVSFSTDVEVTIPVSGTITVDASNTSTGPIVALAGTLTTIDSPITGWDTVTNISDAIEGENEETDAELRARRSRSVARDAQAILDSIIAELLAVTNVTYVTVLENDTDSVDGNGLPAHSFLSIVEGGTDQDIGDAIFLKKPVGIQAFGSTTVQVKDINGFDHAISFSRPTTIPIFVIVNTVDLGTDFPVTGADDIKQAIIDYAEGNLVNGRGFPVSEDVIFSEMYTPVNAIPGHSVTSIFIGTSASPTGQIDIPIAFDEVAQFLTGNIGVNVT